MTRCIAAMLASVGLIGTGVAYAQDSAPGPGSVVVTIIPGGGTFFTEGRDTQGPGFGTYDLGSGVEGELSGALGVAQDLRFSGETLNLKTPNLLNYSGNLVLSAANRSPVVPYVTGGLGGLTVFDKADLGINETETFLLGDVGGGVLVNAWR